MEESKDILPIYDDAYQAFVANYPNANHSTLREVETFMYIEVLTMQYPRFTSRVDDLKRLEEEFVTEKERAYGGLVA